ncbi:hypothetical protein Pan97_38750 [Bremerella volcania]|uniref:Uncharacterized protein n=1 Tax=Bremerella volcania TaxID=2527984 RepID=A0A518CC67_9BACT|nr:hypothetical protein [Bremerella volcania]QDU76818.1 hypothetical protein Pan97_38750 [Bremerella volcania]
MSDLLQEEFQSAGITDTVPSVRPTNNDGPETRSQKSGWILGPWMDLLLIANVFWPMLVLIQYFDDVSSRQAIQFWQIYFITTPHRWSTLGLVLLDRNPYRARPRFFLGFAIAVVLICVGIRIGTGELTCLLAIDYAWNAWHFASQHHGIYRIYGRLAQARTFLPGWLEKIMLRAFMLYCIVRVAQVAIRPGTLSDFLVVLDWVVLILPCVVLFDCLWNWNRHSMGRLVYLVSVVGLFSGMLWAIHSGFPAIVLALTTASAWFHASEYLAVVGWRMHKQSGDGEIDARDRIFQWIASRWVFSLLIFVVVLGSCSWLFEHQFVETWLLLNVIVAFLHYGYDGSLWKKRKVNIPVESAGAC